MEPKEYDVMTFGTMKNIKRAFDVYPYDGRPVNPSTQMELLKDIEDIVLDHDLEPMWMYVSDKFAPYPLWDQCVMLVVHQESESAKKAFTETLECRVYDTLQVGIKIISYDELCQQLNDGAPGAWYFATMAHKVWVGSMYEMVYDDFRRRYLRFVVDKNAFREREFMESFYHSAYINHTYMWWWCQAVSQMVDAGVSLYYAMEWLAGECELQFEALFMDAPVKGWE